VVAAFLNLFSTFFQIFPLPTLWIPCEQIGCHAFTILQFMTKRLTARASAAAKRAQASEAVGWKRMLGGDYCLTRILTVILPALSKSNLSQSFIRKYNVPVSAGLPMYW
jgi:uncharacterized SAM-binding protein YcdF (DUF218 family)